MDEMTIAPKDNHNAQNIIPFVTEITRYFMEFLQTDFHRIRNPKRQIVNRDNSNLQVGINLQKYKKYSSLIWKVIRSSFEDESLQGPPGTGKSHTITAIVCEAILNNKSILVLSDKKEALDVVEDKITEAMNKVRLDKHFQNPILRLGKTGNTYAKILSSTSMERIKEHYKAVREDYKKLESNIDNSNFKLKDEINASISAFAKISMQDIQNFIQLESELEQEKNLPVFLPELESNSNSVDELNTLSEDIAKLSESSPTIDTLFKRFYGDETNIFTFMSFLELIMIVNHIKNELKTYLPYFEKFPNLSNDNIEILQKYISDCQSLKSGLFGYLFKGKKIKGLNDELLKNLAHHLENPHQHIQALKAILSSFRLANQKKNELELTKNIPFHKEFNSHFYQLMSLNLPLPNDEHCRALIETLISIHSILSKYPRSAEKSAMNSNDVFSLRDNKFSQYPKFKLEKILNFITSYRRYICSSLYSAMSITSISFTG